jgi:hypothetical protein
MRASTKTVIYMALDQLESFKKSSNDSSTFISIDWNEYQEARKEIIQILNSKEQKYESIQEKKKALIGTLPYILMDKAKFPNNESIVKLAEESLNYKISTWKKRGREEMIGLIISRIAEDNENQFEVFMDIWKNFISSNEMSENKTTNKQFVDIWLEFFNHYRGIK